MILRIDAYAAGDRLDCLHLFDSNLPEFFNPGERAEYEAFLNRLPGPYFVGRVYGEVVAAGGYARARSGDWVLCWGMVVATRQRMGIGQALLDYRLRTLIDEGVESVVVHTSQKSAGFFERAAFLCEAVAPGQFGLELDMHTLRRRLQNG